MPTNDGRGLSPKRERSTIEFPYQDLDDAVDVAKGVHAVGGSGCQWEQLAANLRQAATGGAFRQRMLAAKTYGLLTYDKGVVTLTSLGGRICDPTQEKAARAESFLAVPLFKAVYEKFKGVNLPPLPGLESAMAALGVASKQAVKARQVFQRSANQSGFFAYGNDRVVMPSIKGSRDVVPDNPRPKPRTDDQGELDMENRKKAHPFIEGLLKALPSPETEWPVEARKKWLQAAADIFDLMFTDPGDGTRTLRIEVEGGSAK